MLAYDVERRKWNIVLQTSYWLNYLSVDKDGSIWISCHKGLWNIDAGLERKQYIPTLKLVDGRNINTEVSTLYNDSQGGMWVGTLNRESCIIIGPFPFSEYWQDIVSRYGKYESLCNLHCSTKPGEYVGGDPERTILLSSF